MVTAIFHTAFVGDLFLAIPLIKRLRSLQGTESLILICRPGLKEFFEKTKLVDHVFELRKTDADSLRELDRVVTEGRVKRIVCPHRSFRSAWILRKYGRACGIERIGYSKWWNSFFFEKRVERPMELAEPLRLLALAAPFDPQAERIVSEARANQSWHNVKSRYPVSAWSHAIPSDLSMAVAPVAVDQTLMKFRLRLPYVILAPTSQWQTKRWTPEGYADLIGRLRARGFNCYLAGTANEASQVDGILEQHSAGQRNADAISSGIAGNVTEARSLAGQTSLLELHAVMTRAHSVIANDSGPMHLAAAAGAPVVGVFGPTTLELGYRPWSDNAKVAQIPLECRPCGKHGHQRCPIGTHDCMKNITAADVEGLMGG